MSAALYMPSPRVRHIAAWTADEHTLLGRHRPICGQERPASTPLLLQSRDEEEGLLDRGNSNPEWERRVRAAFRKPVCRRCIKVAGAIAHLATDGVTS